MKLHDVINPNDKTPDDECDVCYAYEKADKALPANIVCPHCSSPFSCDSLSDMDITLVGETNCVQDNQVMERMIVEQCKKCKGYYAMKAIPITYNANHDIYYTGGTRFLQKEGPKITEAVSASIQQYTDRLKAGEHTLTYVNLQTWIQYDLNNILAKWLYDNGYKY